MVILKNLIILIGIVLALFVGVLESRAATIHAKADRRSVSLNESFTVVYEAEGSVDDDPDFTPIAQHFEILRQSEGSRMEIINGDITRRKSWTLTLMGKDAGFFTIPPISFGADQSPSVRIDIEKITRTKPGGSAEPLFLEVSAEPLSAYVQSQVIYTVRFYRSVNLLSGQLSEPKVSDADVVVEKIGEDREFETTRHGKRYLVVEKRYGIFPQQSGPLTIAPLNFAGQLGGRSRGMFSPFPGAGAIKRLRSKEIRLEIKAVPQDKVRGRWLPAKNLQLAEIWPESSDGESVTKVGEPVTWTLQLAAEGLTAAQLPEIDPKFPKNFKSYPDQPILENQARNDNILGIRQEKIAFVPTRPGSHLLPAIEIPWWNTVTEKMEIARLPARRIQVAPADKVEQALPPIAPQHDLSGRTTTQSPSVTVVSGSWPWISLALGIAWIGTLAAWWFSRQKSRRAQSSAHETRSSPLDITDIKKRLKRACLQNDANPVKEALLGWGHALWPERPISLGEIGKRVGGPLRAEIQQLSTALYSQNTSTWENGAILWRAFEVHISNQKKKIPSETEGLVPMYP